ncbi:hypothetical protein CLU79DRAFT_861837 [Phycomyces nitens]|nr:hypothetical protein CLU79DRAFT_861837 [Phycomyces nitens]
MLKKNIVPNMVCPWPIQKAIHLTKLPLHLWITATINELTVFFCTAASNVHSLLNIDSNIHGLLAVSSIFIVQSRIEYDTPMPVAIQEHLNKTLCKNRLEKLDPHLTTRLKDIIYELRDKSISKTEAQIQLLQLSMNIDGPSENVVLAIE